MRKYDVHKNVTVLKEILQDCSFELYLPEVLLNKNSYLSKISGYFSHSCLYEDHLILFK